MDRKTLSILQCVFCMFVAAGCLFSVLHQRLMRAERRLNQLESQARDTEFVIRLLLREEQSDRIGDRVRNVSQP